MEKGQTIRDIYKERSPLYEAYADIIIDCSSKEVSENAKKIAESVKSA